MNHKSIDTSALRSIDGDALRQIGQLRQFGDCYGDETYGTVAEQPDQVFRFVPASRSWIDLTQVADAKAAIGWLPADGETVHMVLSGKFTPFNFIPATMELAGCGLEDLTLATLTFSADNGADLLALHEAGRVKRLSMLVSHWFSQASRHLYDPFAAQMKTRGQSIGTYRTHCKIWLMLTDDGRHYVIESSANVRSCKCLENATFTRDSGLYRFHKTWIDRTLKA